MAEPSSTTVSLGLGLFTLLAGVFGVVAADVIMVTLSSIAGCSLALSGVKSPSFRVVVEFMGLSILIALTSSWTISHIIVSYAPSFDGPYLPSIISLLIGTYSDKLFYLRNLLLKFGLKKTGVDASPELNKNDKED